MATLKNIWASEPVLITTLVGSVLALLVTFGISLPVGAVTAIDGVILAVVAFRARSQVSSPATTANTAAVASIAMSDAIVTGGASATKPVATLGS